MASKDWEETRDEVAKKAIDALTDIKRHAATFLADHPEIKDTIHDIETVASDGIKKLLNSRK